MTIAMLNWNQSLNFSLALGLMGIISGCLHFSEGNDSFGLTIIEIELNSQHLARLNSSVWAKRPVSGKVKVGQRTIAANISYAGKSTIDAPKKSFDLDLGQETYQGLRTIRLSSQYVDKSMLRSLVGFRVYEQFGLTAPLREPVSVYLNGTYQGLYLMVETVDADMLSRRSVEPKAIYKAIFANADFNRDLAAEPPKGLAVKLGPDGYHDVKALIEAIDSSEQGNIAEILRLTDRENTLKYFAVSAVLNNWDGYDNNFFLVMDKKTQRFHFQPWDLDRILEPKFSKYQKDNHIWPRNRLMQKLLENRDFRSDYLDFLLEVLESPTLAGLADFIREQSRNLEAAFDADPFLEPHGPISRRADQLIETLNDWTQALRADAQSLKLNSM